MIKPIPWFWLAQFLAVAVAGTAWEIYSPHTPIWKLFLVGVVVFVAIEGLRIVYRQEQARITERHRKVQTRVPEAVPVRTLADPEDPEAVFDTYLDKVSKAQTTAELDQIQNENLWR